MIWRSRTIPCIKCGKVGETYKTIMGWYCVECLNEKSSQKKEES